MNRLAFWMALGIAIGAGVAQALDDPAWIAAGAGLGTAAGLAVRHLRRRSKSPPEA
ncbi:hypothetical protein DFR49_2252 [Hephaestia caeni]|uniref:Uncharacterized protein n=1 Tax=Hephaestia caeni TaxID=645617 RepID=A0A397PA09_9SPHN|nr:hypothetical protein [Hephaestia caeni]RIA44017.1 hypothetical protein DFR49_2252 [Hephaestia caeni]